MRDYLSQIIREAGTIAKDFFVAGVDHRTKANLGDYLTDADIAVNDFLCQAIREQYPTHQIHTEENKEDINPGAEYEWVIDPIDGTRNFAIGLPFWCILIAVLKEGEGHLSGIYNPIANQLFLAETGKGATLNGKAIHVNAVSSLDHALVVSTRGSNSTHGDKYKQLMCNLANDTNSWMCNFGTMLPACYVASGGIDFFASNSGFDHDILSVAHLCKEAGAMVTDSDGKGWTRYRRDVVIANPALHPKVLALFQAGSAMREKSI